jgi:exodeoxyribonuclease VII large subunit
VRAAGEKIASRRQHIRALKAELPDPAHLLSRQRHRLDDLTHRSEGSVRAFWRKKKGHLDEIRSRLGTAEPRARLRALAERVQKGARRLETWQAAFFRRESLRLERLASRLEPANVAKMLSRGFSLVIKDGLLVKESRAVARGESLRIVLGSGWLDVDVQHKDTGVDPLRRPAR